MLNKSLYIVLFLATVTYANTLSDSNDTKDEFVPAENKNVSNLKSKIRDGYMPNIITPDKLKSGIYGGLGLGANQLKFDSDSNTLTTLSLVAGYNFNSYIATESRVMISVANSKSIDYKNLSIYLKPKYEVTSGLDIYSLIGFGKVKANSINDKSTKSSKGTMQYGIGAGYKLENNFKIFADYTYLGKDANAKYKNSPSVMKSGSLTAGVTYDF